MFIYCFWLRDSSVNILKYSTMLIIDRNLSYVTPRINYSTLLNIPKTKSISFLQIRTSRVENPICLCFHFRLRRPTKWFCDNYIYKILWMVDIIESFRSINRLPSCVGVVTFSGIRTWKWKFIYTIETWRISFTFVRL